MPAGPRVSVIIPHYGAAHPTLELIAALRSQQGAPETEIVVVDDASPEPFAQVAGLTLVTRPSNGGFGSAVNSGAEVARGELLLVLNSDLSIGPTFLADLVSAAAPWLPAVVGPAILHPDGTPAWTGRRFPRTSQQAVEWLSVLARFRDTRAWHRAVGHDLAAVPGATVVVDWLVGAALLIPAAAFAEVGGFDERFHMNAEEVDLQRRLRERGLPAVYAGQVHAVHEGGGSSDPALRRRWLTTARTTYARKWNGTGGVARLRTALSAATAVNLAVNTARAVAGREIHPWEVAREEWNLIWQPGTDLASGRASNPTQPPASPPANPPATRPGSGGR